MDNFRLYTGVLLFLCLFSFVDFDKLHDFITEQKILQIYKNSEKMLGFGVTDYNNGVYIVDVLDLTPAQKAGLQEWDKILEVDGKKITNVFQFKEMIENFHKNKLLNILVYRKSSGNDVKITIRPLVLIP